MTLFLGYATEHLGKSPTAVQLIGHHAGVGPEVPGPPGARAAQLGAQPQPAADGAAGVPEVRRPPRRDGTARRRAGDGRADEALRAAAAGPPDAARDDRRAGAAGRRLDLAARPSAAEPALQHRRTRVGDRRGARRRRGAGRCGLRPSARQGPQGSLGAAVEVDRGSHPRLAACQPRPARLGSIAAQPIRPSDDAVQRGAATGPRRRPCLGRAAEPEDQARLAAQPEAHDRHAPAAKRRALQRHRPVARPREHEHDAPLRRGQPGDEGEGARATRSARHQAQALPRQRRPDEVPAEPVKHPLQQLVL